MVFEWLGKVCGCTSPAQQAEAYELDDLRNPGGPSAGSRQTDRPDLSNIDYVADEGIRNERLKRAIRPFAEGQYNQAEVMKSYFESKRIEARSSQAREMALGICLGLSSSWIRLHNSAPEADRVGSALRTTPEIEAAQALQQLYMAAKMEAKRAAAGDDDETNATGLRAVFERQRFKVEDETKSDCSGNGIGSLFSTGGYYILSLTGLNAGHVICVWRPPGRARKDQYIRVFDPNGGEFKIGTSDVVYFFTALMARYRSLGWNYFNVTGYRITPS
jgi:hypothetical protein